jgi:hypothetical protein
MNKLFGVGVLLVLLAALSFAQGPSEQIEGVITTFLGTVQQGKIPAQTLSPNTQSRDVQLGLFRERFTTFSITYHINELSLHGETHANLPATIEWTRAGSSLQRHTSLQFEKVNDAWYFTDFDFVKFPYALFISIAAAGFLLAMMILALRYKMRRKASRSQGT